MFLIDLMYLLLEVLIEKIVYQGKNWALDIERKYIYLVVTFLTKSTVFEFSSMKARHRSFNRTSFSAADNPPPGSEGFPSPVPPVNTTRARNIGMDMLRLKSILGCDDTLFQIIALLILSSLHFETFFGVSGPVKDTYSVTLSPFLWGQSLRGREQPTLAQFLKGWCRKIDHCIECHHNKKCDILKDIDPFLCQFQHIACSTFQAIWSSSETHVLLRQNHFILIPH